MFISDVIEDTDTHEVNYQKIQKIKQQSETCASLTQHYVRF